MKIAIWHNLPSGGGKRSLYHHVQGLLANGHIVESWCPPTADQSYLPLSELVTEYVVAFDGQSRKVKNVVDELLIPYYQSTDKIAAMDAHCRRCAEEINHGNFDVLFVNPCQFFRVTAIGRYINIPKILYLQEPYRPLYEAMPNPPWAALPVLEKSYWSKGNRKAFVRNLAQIQGLRVQVREEWQNAQAFNQILVNSCFSRESVLRAYGLEAQVCYLGIDTSLFVPLNLPREHFVVGLGAIYPGKGIERAVQGLGAVAENIRPDLVWIGNFADEFYQSKIMHLAQSLGVNVIFKVKISDAEIVELLNRARAMVYAPLLEPFGFAPLEANACDTPVVAIAEGGVRETVQNGINGLLIHNNDSAAMGEAISRLVTDPELAHRMGKQARNYVVENWTWDSAISRLEKYLLQAVAQNPKPVLAALAS